MHQNSLEILVGLTTAEKHCTTDRRNNKNSSTIFLPVCPRRFIDYRVADNVL